MTRRSDLLVTVSVVTSVAFMIAAHVAFALRDAATATFFMAFACYALAWAAFVCVYAGRR